MDMKARRALLYVPGDDYHKIQKAVTLGVDCICMDMEDGVSADRKAQARLTIKTALESLGFSKSERLARINPVGSGLEMDDLETVLPAHPDGIVIPKVESAGQVGLVSSVIANYEARMGLPENSVELIIVIESGLGIINLNEIAKSDPRLKGIIFGAEDFAEDIGATRTKEGGEVLFARSSVVTHAAAYGLQAIDMVFIDFKDPDGLYQEALVGARMGFSGKQVIHPNQVEPVQKAFTPDEEAISHALRVIRAFEESRLIGRGAFALDGRMIDAPIVKSAHRVLERAKAAGKLD